MRAVRATGFSLACLVAGALFATPAGAAIQTSYESVTIGSGGTQSVEARCAAGTVPVSAGFAASQFTFLGGGIVPFASMRLADGSRATGTNAGGPPRHLTTYANCDTQPLAIVTRGSQLVQLPAGSQRSAAVSCPAGSVPISGGYRFANSSNGTGAAVLSRRVHRGWEVAGYNGGPGPSALMAYVYCQRNAAPLQGQFSKQTLVRFSHGGADARCPDGTRTVSGGFNGHLSMPSGSLRVALPYASRRVGNTWRVTAASADAPTATLTAFAYCEATS
jgi:hypothetical protein